MSLFSHTPVRDARLDLDSGDLLFSQCKSHPTPSPHSAILFPLVCFVLYSQEQEPKAHGVSLAAKTCSHNQIGRLMLAALVSIRGRGSGSTDGMLSQKVVTLFRERRMYVRGYLSSLAW